MFFDPRITLIYIYRDFIDCRKAHNGLVYLVTEVMNHELKSGNIFLFASKDRKTAKAIKWDGTGVIMLHKKMESGKIMHFNDLSTVTEISSENLMSILSGAKVRLDLSI